MDQAMTKLYMGLEVGTDDVMITSYTNGMTEPETISRMGGSGNYKIPMALCKKRGIGQWFYGEEALALKDSAQGSFVTNLYETALKREKVEVDREPYEAEELLALFLRKVMMLPRKLGGEREIGRVVVALDKLNVENTRMMERVLGKAGLTEAQYQLIDAKESFLYYALNQKKELCLHQIAHFDCTKDFLKFECITKNTKTTPQLIHIDQKDCGMLYGDKDKLFSEYITECFSHRIISSVYLTGDGFDGDWMKESIKILCRGRKAYMGKNMVSKGACFAAMVKSGILSWDYAYIGENELKINVSLKVRDHGEMAFYSLLSAGESWFESQGLCEVILDGEAEIDFWLQEPDSREAKIHSVKLEDFPQRENKTSRLRISAKPLSDTQIQVRIKDLGFGEIVKASEKVWEYVIEL